MTGCSLRLRGFFPGLTRFLLFFGLTQGPHTHIFSYFFFLKFFLGFLGKSKFWKASPPRPFLKTLEKTDSSLGRVGYSVDVHKVGVYDDFLSYYYVSM